MAAREAARSQVYCQMEGREISASLCENMQGQDACLGCGAATRRCEKCGESPVDVPMVGLCTSCLEIERAEALDIEREIPQRVQCQIMKRSISATMCTSMQGQEGCQGCSAPTRNCVSCNERAPHSAKFGLCLECIAAEFAPSLAAESKGTEGQKNTSPPVLQKLPADVERLMQKYGYVSHDLLTSKLHIASSVAQTKIRDLVTSGSLREDTGGLYVRATGIVVKLPHHDLAQEVETKSAGLRDRKTLLAQARSLIEKHRHVTVSMLVKNLGVTQQLSRSLLDVLVHEKFIDCDDSGQRRRYIFVLKEPLQEPQPPVERADEVAEITSERRFRQIQLLEKFAHAVGEHSEHGRMFLEIRDELIQFDKLDSAIRNVLGE